MAKDKGKQEAPAEDVAPAEETPQQGTALTAANNTAMAEYDPDDFGAGFEDMTREDYAIPFLGVLQKMSPQVDESGGHYVEGAKAGMIINSVTGDLFPGIPPRDAPKGAPAGIEFIPVHREHSYIEWIPRDQGGGFVGKFEPTDPLVIKLKEEQTEYGKLQTAEGNDLVETFTVYGLVVDENGGYSPAVISFSSTQIKVYKNWMTKANAVQVMTSQGRRPAPLFGHRYNLRTRFNENKKGTWHGWDVYFAGEEYGTTGNSRTAAVLPGTDLYTAAKGFRDIVMSGAAQVDMSKAEAPAADSETGDVF